MTQDGLDQIFTLIEDIKEGLNADEVIARYLELSALDPADPSPYWHLREAISGESIRTAIKEALDLRAEESAEWEAHAVMFSGYHFNDQKSLDSKLRELARKGDGDISEWQAYRYIELDKWRNIQQVYADRCGGDRAEGARLVAQLAHRVEAPDATQADFWKQVYQVNRDDLEAQEALIKLYGKLEKWKEYAEVYLRYLETLDEYDVDARREGLNRLIEVYTNHLKSDQILTDLYQQLFTLDPSDHELVELLKAQYSKLRKWPLLIDVYQTRADVVDGAERLSVLAEMADIYLNQLRKIPEAQDVYEAILDEDPHHKASLEAMTALYEKKREWDQWAEYSQRLAETRESAEERSLAYQELAHFAEKKIRQSDLALSLWERAYQEDDQAPDPLRALLSMYEQQKMWSEFDVTTTRLIELSAIEDDERVQVIFKVASVTEDQERALEWWRMLLDIDPEHKKGQEQFKRALVAVGDWDTLTAFYAEHDGWAELVKTLESQANTQSEDDDKVALYFRASEIWLRELDQADRAIRALERVTQIDANHLEAAERLIPLYQEAQQYAKLAGSLEILVQFIPDSEDTLSRVELLVQLYEQELKRLDQAFAWATRLVELNPVIPSGWSAIIRIASDLRPPRWSEAYQALLSARDLARIELDTELFCQLTLMIAEIAELQLSDDEAALSAYLEVIELDPEQHTALDSIERIYERQQRWDEVLLTLERKLEVTTEDEQREALYFKQATLYRDYTEDRNQAIEALNQVLSIQPNRIDALQAIRALYELEGDLELLHEMTDRELALSDSEVDRFALGLELAHLELNELNRSENAIERLKTLLNKAQDSEALSDVKVIESLEGALAHPEAALAAAAVLKPWYQERAQWPEYVKTLEVILKETIEEEERKNLLEEIIRVQQEQLQDLPATAEVLCRLLQELPEHTDAGDSLYLVCEHTSQWSLYVEAIERALIDTTDVTLAIKRLIQLATVYEKALELPSEALGAYERVLGYEPAHSQALEQLDRYYREFSEWYKLLEVLRARAELVEPSEEKQPFLIQIAEVYEQNLNAPQEAIAAYQEALSLVPDHQSSLRALARLFEVLEMWPELSEGLLKLRSLMEGPEQIELTLRLAEIQEIYLHQPELAFEFYEEALSLDSSYHRVIESLERYLSEDDFKGRAATLLAPVFEQQQDLAKLILCHQVSAEVKQAEGSHDEAVAHLHRVAELYLSVEAMSEAFETYTYAFNLNPNDETTATQLALLTGRNGDWATFATVYEQVIHEIHESDVKLRRAKTLGATYIEKLNELNRSIELYELAFEIDRQDVEVLNALERLYEHAERWHSLTDLYLHRATLFAESPAEVSEDEVADVTLSGDADRTDSTLQGNPVLVRAYTLKAADLFERFLDEPQQAIELYQGLLDGSSSDLELLDALERLQYGLQQWNDLIEVLLRREPLLDTSEDQIALRFRVAEAFESEALSDPESAIEHYQKILTLDEGNLQALLGLERVYHTLDRWEDHCQILDAQLELLSDLDRVATLYRKAVSQQVNLNEPKLAIEGYREILVTYPHHEEAKLALEGLIQAGIESESAIEVLRNALKTTAEYERLVLALRSLLTVSNDTTQAADIYIEIGSLLKDELAHPSGATEAYAEALRNDATRAGLYDTLYQLVAPLGAWEYLSNTLTVALSETEHEDARALLYAKSAEVYESHLDAPFEAIEQLCLLRELRPEETASLVSLARLYEQTQQWEQLAEVLRAHADQLEEAVPTTPPVDQTAETSSDEDESFTADQTFIADDESELDDPVEGLESLEAEEDQQSDFGDSEPTSMIHLTSDTASSAQADLEQQVDSLVQGISDDLLDMSFADDAGFAADYEEPKAQEDTVEISARTALRRELLIKLADVFVQYLAAPLEAISVYEEIFEMIRQDQGALMGLRALFGAGIEQLRVAEVLAPIFTEMGSWRELYDQSQVLLAYRTEGKERLDAFMELAQLALDRLQEAPTALMWFGEAFKEDPMEDEARLALHDLALSNGYVQELAALYGEARLKCQNISRLGELSHLIARIAFDHIRDYELAEREYLYILELNAYDLKALEGLDLIYSSQERSDVLEEILLREKDLVEASERDNLTWRLGELYEGRLDEPFKAIEQFEELTESSDRPDALAKLEQLYTQVGDAPALFHVYARQVEQSDGDELIEVMKRRAHLAGGALNDPLEAISLWREVLERSVDDPDGLTALELLYEQQEDWRELVDVIERQVQLARGDQAREVAHYTRLALVWGEKLERTQSALDAWKEVLDREPNHIEARWSMRQLFARDRRHAEHLQINLELLELIPEPTLEASQLIAQAAERTFDGTGQTRQVILEQEPTPYPVSNDEKDSILSDHEFSAQQGFSLESKEAIYDFGEEESTSAIPLPEVESSEVENDPGLGLSFDALEAESTPVGQDQFTAELTPMNEVTPSVEPYALLDEVVIQDQQNRERRFIVYCELGELYEGFEDVESALNAWGSALELNAHAMKVVDRLLSLYQLAEDWGNYAWILARKAELLTDPSEKIERYLELAQLYEAPLEMLFEAVSAYQSILEIERTHVEAFYELERLLKHLERADDLIRLYLARVEVAEDHEEAQNLYVNASEVYEAQGQFNYALSVQLQAFVLSFDDERYGEHLESLATKAQMQVDLIQTYESAIQNLGAESFETIPLRLRVAHWYDEALQQPQHAVTHYQFIQHIDPQNPAPLAAQETLYKKHGHWALAAQMAEQRLALIYEDSEFLDTWRSLAQLRQQHLGDSNGAQVAYEEVLKIDPDDLEALAQLKQLYTMKQSFPALVDVLLRESQLSEDLELKVENLLRAAEVREVRMNDVLGAIDAYRDAYELDQSCVDALFALELLYRQQNNWEELRAIYEALLIARTDANDQLKTYGKFAQLQLEHLGEREGAIDSYRRMFQIDPTHDVAINALDQLYREEGRYDDLKNLYDSYLHRIQNPQQQTSIRLALAELSQLTGGSIDESISYLSPIVEIDPTNTAVFQKLTSLYQEADRWEEAVQSLRSELALITDRSAQLERLCYLGQLYVDPLNELDQAIGCYQQALDLSPHYTPALSALKDVFERKEMYHDVVRILMMMEANTTNYREKSEHYYEMGRIYAELLGDMNTGIDYYQQAIDLDPKNVTVAPHLVDYYLQEERWERAEPLLDLLLSDDHIDDPHLRKQRHFELAQCALNLHNENKAEEQFSLAYKLDSTHFPTLNGLAEIYLRQERWEDAFNFLQAILIHYNDKLQEDQRMAILFKQGKAKFNLGDHRRALDVLTRVIETHPEHREALDLLILTFEGREKWHEAISYRQRRAELEANEDLRFEELIEIGDIYSDQLDLPQEAIRIFEKALEINESSKRIFYKLLPLYEVVEDWISTVQLLMHFANIEEDTETKAKLYFAIGSLQRDQINDHLQAVRSFDKALEADPHMLKAFAAIENLLTQERNFERQDRYFRKMLKRANEHKMGSDMIFKLASALGEINRSRLNRYQEAIKAYQIALRHQPADLETRDIVAELYEKESDWDKAIAQHREILKRDIRQINSLHKLFRLYCVQGSYDEAWCIAQALVYLRNARSDEQELYERHHARSLNEVRQSIENEHWGFLMHDKKSPLMDQLFQCLYRYNAVAMERNHQKDFGVHKRKDLISDKDETPLNRMLSYVSRVTNLPRVPTYAGPTGSKGLIVMNTSEPAVLVGQDMFRISSLQGLAFSMAKTLLLATPLHMMATIDIEYDMRRNRLMMIIFTLMKMAGVEVEHFDPGLLDVYRRIEELDLVRLNELLNEMQQDPHIHLDVSRWLEGLDHSANRLGLVVCNDLTAAAQAIRNETTAISKVGVAERIQELVLFSISDEYFALRQALGVAIKAG